MGMTKMRQSALVLGVIGTLWQPCVATEQKEDNMSKFSMTPLENTWRFKTDPEKKGEQERWHLANYDDKSWAEARSDNEGGWAAQGFKGYTGCAWYRQRVSIPDECGQRAFLFLFFSAVDEEGEVYINGEKVFDHTYAATNLKVDVMWKKPFSFDAKKFLKPGGENLIAVRVTKNNPGAGGIWKPVFLVGADTAADTKEIAGQLTAQGKLDPIYYLEHIKIPPIPPHPDEALFGSRIQRTMTLLATSNAERRHTVKILVYGQSITQGLHWERIVKTLQERYPHANIIAENRSIGGLTAPSLIRPALHDVYPFYPDLLIFHVYAGALSGEWEQIIANVRKRTTAEIMVFTHQVAWVDKEEGMRKRRLADDEDSDNIRYVAQKYNCELVEVRREWEQYLEANKLTPNMLMGNKIKSNVHPNKEGHTLLAGLILRHFRVNTILPGGWSDQVRTYYAWRPLLEGMDKDEVVLSGPSWQRTERGVVSRSSNDVLKLSFEGNRVDVVATDCKDLGSARILIDGKPPSQFPELYVVTRPSKMILADYPALLRVTLGSQDRVCEKWTLKIKEINDNASAFTYDLTGSVTGFDGTGSHKAKFVSNSGRILIDPSNFMVATVIAFARKNDRNHPELQSIKKNGFEVTWEVAPMFMDIWKPRPITDESLEDRYTLAQGLENGRHTLEIIPNGDGNIPVKEIVAFRPPMR